MTALIAACGLAAITMVTWVLHALRRCGLPCQWLYNATGGLGQQPFVVIDVPAVTVPHDGQHSSTGGSQGAAAGAAGDTLTAEWDGSFGTGVHTAISQACWDATPKIPAVLGGEM